MRQTPDRQRQKGSRGSQKQAEAEAALEKAANERLQSFQSRLQDVQGQLEQTRQAQQNYAQSVKDSITNLVNFQDAFADKGEGSFIDSLRKQADAAQTFGGKITTLLGLGLNRTSIDNILAAGAEVGSSIADEIIAGGSSAIGEINSLVAAVETSASSLAAATSAKWYDAGLAQGQAMVDGIIAAAAAVGLAFVDGQLQIPAAITATATVTEAPAKKRKKPKNAQRVGQFLPIKPISLGKMDPNCLPVKRAILRAIPRWVESILQSMARSIPREYVASSNAYSSNRAVVLNKLISPGPRYDHLRAKSGRYFCRWECLFR